MANSMMRTSDALRTVAEEEKGERGRAVCLEGAKALGHLEAELYKYQTIGTVEELTALKEQTRWIPVSERLPERYRLVLVCCPLWDLPLIAYTRDDDEFFTGTDVLNTPKYWMPLPEAPKEEEK